MLFSKLLDIRRFTHLAAVTYTGSVLLKMDMASGSLPDLYTAFTTWLSQDWCMLSTILSASSMIWDGAEKEK